MELSPLTASLEDGLEQQHRIMSEAVRGARFVTWSVGRLCDGLVAPSWHALMQMDADVLMTSVRALASPRDAMALGGELADRVNAGLRYPRLVRTLGASLFGSARWPGEEVLGEDDFFRLSYLPPAAGAPTTPVRLFHLGGVLPYGDPLFRLLPEVNFFDRFLERGVGVYAMELKGDATTLDYRNLSLEEVVAAIGRHSETAAAHAAGNRLVLEGYCGLASQAIAYVAARPDEADARFAAVATFVGPIDGRRCTLLAESVQLMPEDLMVVSYCLSECMDGYVSGDGLRLSQDLALRALFLKTPLGMFVTGWQHPEWAPVDRREDLTPEQRRLLAGAYWISPENGRRFPVPIDLSRYSAALFTQGIGPDGEIPFTLGGQPLSLAALRQTRLRFVGFYGAKDPMVPGETAACLMQALGSRYVHVVHPNAGHVTYVFSPKAWLPGGPKSLNPNPVDLIVSLATEKPAAVAVPTGDPAPAAEPPRPTPPRPPRVKPSRRGSTRRN